MRTLDKTTISAVMATFGKRSGANKTPEWRQERARNAGLASVKARKTKQAVIQSDTANNATSGLSASSAAKAPQTPKSENLTQLTDCSATVSKEPESGASELVTSGDSTACAER